MNESVSAHVRTDLEVRALSAADKQALARHFNERVDSALAAAPPTKEWVKTALARGGAARCPTRLRRLSYDIILRYGDALADLFVAYPDDTVFALAYDLFIGFQPVDRTDRIDPLTVLTGDARWVDEWGTAWQHALGGVGASPVANPLPDWSGLDDYLARRIPDAHAPGRLDGALAAVERFGPTKYCCGLAQLALFERQHCIRGMGRTFEDFSLAADEVDRLLGALTDYYVELVREWGRLDGVDSVFLTDDWGTQTSLMISPSMWRRFFQPRYRRICDEAHRHGLQLVFHSCGNVTRIIGDLIDCGIDVLDPLQPEAMDLEFVAREFGGHVAFSGGISDQKLAALSPQEVSDHVRRSIDTLGRRCGNAYIAAPSNVLLPDVPLANLEALFEASHNP
ncbi:MAG: uroporphyrinogen decarboxylase family protein [Isosphaeraceae bacterium]